MTTQEIVDHVKAHTFIDAIWPDNDAVTMNCGDPCDASYRPEGSDRATITQLPDGTLRYTDNDGEFTTKSSGKAGLKQLARAVQSLMNVGWRDWNGTSDVVF